MGKQQIPRTTISYSSTASAFEKGKQWTLAFEMLEQMDLAKVFKDSMVHNAAMSACEKSSQWQKAQSLFAALPPKLRDNYSFNAVMTACAAGKKWEQTISLLEMMQKDLLQCDSFSYAASIAACGARRWTMALALFWEAERKNLVGRVIFNEVLDAICEEDVRSESCIAYMRHARLFTGLEAHAHTHMHSLSH